MSCKDDVYSQMFERISDRKERILNGSTSIVFDCPQEAVPFVERIFDKVLTLDSFVLQSNYNQLDILILAVEHLTALHLSMFPDFSPSTFPIVQNLWEELDLLLDEIVNYPDNKTESKVNCIMLILQFNDIYSVFKKYESLYTIVNAIRTYPIANPNLTPDELSLMYSRFVLYINNNKKMILEKDESIKVEIFCDLIRGYLEILK